MGKQNKAGFTIIEVTLFLAISGLLILLLLGGWSVMINTQRYKDSIKTTQSFLQKQYSLAYNVENGRSANYICEDGNVSEVDPGGVPRGQEDCVILGRLIHVKKGTDMAVYPIVGKDVDVEAMLAGEAQTNYIEEIRALTPKYSTEDIGIKGAEYTVPWQATVVKSSVDPSGLNYIIAIIRSPSSGVAHTFSKQVADDSLPAKELVGLIDAGNEKEVLMCIDAGAPISGGRMGVKIAKNASTGDFVQNVADGTGQCG